MTEKVSTTPTAYATICRTYPDEFPGCGKVYMTEEFHDYQMSLPDSTWRCAACGREAEWDDSNYEERMGVE